MTHDTYWTADELAIASASTPGGLAAAERRQLRTLLERLAAVTGRAELLDVIGSCLEGPIGASTFGVLERSPGRGVATLLWARGDEALLRRATWHPRVRETLRYGTSHTRSAARRAAEPSPAPAEPVASIPLWGMGGNVCGALVLAELDPLKCQLDRQDHRFLTLLASEGGRLLCTLSPDDRVEGAA